MCSTLKLDQKYQGEGGHKVSIVKIQPTLIQGIPLERAFPSENFDVWYVKIGPKMAKLEQFENFGLVCFVT